MAQLERPARPASLGHAFSKAFGRAGLRGRLAFSVNRASTPDLARLAVAGAGGRPIRGASVELTYSMPSMGMWRVYSSRLDPVAGSPGSYGATEGILGMPGAWRIDVVIALPGHGPERFSLRDHVPS